MSPTYDKVPQSSGSSKLDVMGTNKAKDEVKNEDDKSKGSEKDDASIKKMVNEFNEVFQGDGISIMDTEPMVIRLIENYVPKALTVPRKVPYARRDEEIKEIRKLEADGIIEPIGDRPTEFCSPTICPIKPDGSLRFATDFTHLNKQVLRTVHPTMSPWDAIHSTNPKANFFPRLIAKRVIGKFLWQRKAKT